jgi:hypothetical protein
MKHPLQPNRLLSFLATSILLLLLWRSRGSVRIPIPESTNSQLGPEVRRNGRARFTLIRSWLTAFLTSAFLIYFFASILFGTIGVLLYRQATAQPNSDFPISMIGVYVTRPTYDHYNTSLNILVSSPLDEHPFFHLFANLQKKRRNDKTAPTPSFAVVLIGAARMNVDPAFNPVLPTNEDLPIDDATFEATFQCGERYEKPPCVAQAQVFKYDGEPGGFIQGELRKRMSSIGSSRATVKLPAIGNYQTVSETGKTDSQGMPEYEPVDVQIGLGQPYVVSDYKSVSVRIQDNDILNHPTAVFPPLEPSKEIYWPIEWKVPSKGSTVSPGLPLRAEYSVSNPAWAEVSQRKNLLAGVTLGLAAAFLVAAIQVESRTG